VACGRSQRRHTSGTSIGHLTMYLSQRRYSSYKTNGHHDRLAEVPRSAVGMAKMESMDATVAPVLRWSKVNHHRSRPRARHAQTPWIDGSKQGSAYQFIEVLTNALQGSFCYESSGPGAPAASGSSFSTKRGEYNIHKSYNLEMLKIVIKYIKIY